jgi:hypothetical protein
MLFDLRGRGRRNTIKAIYIFLALLMGVGLVGFGIGGGANSNGGLLDAITGNGSSSSDTGEKRFQKLVDQATAKIQANPSDEAAYVQLIRARVQLAGSGDRYDANKDTYNDQGLAELHRAAAEWDKYEALNPKNAEEESRVASLMVRALVSLNDLSKATAAQEVIATHRDSAGAYTQLAILAYQAGQTRKGDLAAKTAIAKTDKDLRNSLKAQLDEAKQQALQQSVQQALPSPTPSIGG